MTPTLFIMYGLLIITVLSQPNGPDPPIQCADAFQCKDQDVDQQRGEIACGGLNSCQNALLTAAYPTLFSGDVSCSGALSCYQSRSIDASRDALCSGHKGCYVAKSISSRDAICGGWQSCTSVPITTEKFLECNGKDSCNRVVSNAGKSVWCDGEYSCSPITITAVDSVLCDGYRSCQYATITAGVNVECGGYVSCMGANINAAATVKLYGLESGADIEIINVPLIEAYGNAVFSMAATIDSGSVDSMTVNLYGVWEKQYDQHLDIICRAGAHCSINCKGTGCAGATYRCIPGSVCNVKPTSCKTNWGDSVNGVDCPQYTTSADIAVVKEKHDEEDDDIDDIDDMDGDNEDRDGILKGDITECNTENKCRGQLIDDDSVGCSALSSCQDTIIKHSGGKLSVSCTGEDSCLSSNITDISTAGSTSCDGKESCLASIIKGGMDVECIGEFACENAIIHTNRYSMRCSASASCYKAEIINQGGRVYCSGTSSCYGGRIYANNFISCSGMSACYNGDLVSDTAVYCMGMGSCVSATIKIPEELKIYGFMAAYEAIISFKEGPNNNPVIKAEGYKSMMGATIDSKNTDTMRVEMMSHMAGFQSSVICRTGSVCTLVCFGTGCMKLDYKCQNGAICNILPDKCNAKKKYKGVNCPKMTSFANDKEVNEFLERKKIDKENNDIYIESQKEIRLSGYHDHNAEDSKLLLLGKENMIYQQELSNNYQSFGIIIVGILLIVSIICLWCKVKCNNNKEYKILS